MRMTKVIYKKLRNFWGFAYTDKNRIELNEKLQQPKYAKKHLEILCHEKMHLLFPKYDEMEIVRLGKEFSHFLWKLGYRQVK